MRLQARRSALLSGAAEAGDAIKITIATSLQAVEGAWRALESSGHCTPFQTYDWLAAYREASDPLPPREVAIVVVWSNDKLAMIVPLAIERRWGASYLRWLGHDVNDYNSPIIDLAWARALKADDMQLIWERILAELPPADYVHIQRQPALLEGCLNPFRHLAATSDTCRAYGVKFAGPWPEAYEALRSAKSRRRLREKMKRLAKSGPVRLRRVRQESEQREVLHQLISWKCRQLQASGDSNPFADGTFEHFLVAASAAAGPKGAPRLFVLEVGTTVAAAALCLAGPRDLNLFITAHDPETFQQCSAGTLMMIKLMEITARSGRRVFDLSCGDEPYKLDWKVDVMDLFVTQRPLSLKGYLVKILESTRLAAIKWIKRRGWALRFGQSLRRHWSRLRPQKTDACPPPRGPAATAAAGLGLALDGARALHCALYERLTSRHLMQ